MFVSRYSREGISTSTKLIKVLLQRPWMVHVQMFDYRIYDCCTCSFSWSAEYLCCSP